MSTDSPTCVGDLSGDFHLLGGAFVQFLQAAGEHVLDRSRLLRPTRVHRPLRPAKRSRTEEGVGEPRPPITDAPVVCSSTHATKRAREAEELRKNIVSVPGVEPEDSGAAAAAAAGEEGGVPRTISLGRRKLPLQAFFSVLIVDCALLRVT